MKLLNIGDKIPNFECYDNDGNLFSEKNLLGKKLLFFSIQKQILRDVQLKHVIYLRTTQLSKIMVIQ